MTKKKHPYGRQQRLHVKIKLDAKEKENQDRSGRVWRRLRKQAATEKEIEDELQEFV